MAVEAFAFGDREKKSARRQFSVRDSFDGKSAPALETTSRRCCFDEYGKEKSSETNQDVLQEKSAEIGW
jgi:hypothetical protein